MGKWVEKHNIDKISCAVAAPQRQQCFWCDPELLQAAGQVLQLRLPVKRKRGLITNFQKKKGRDTDLEIAAPVVLRAAPS